MDRFSDRNSHGFMQLTPESTTTFPTRRKNSKQASKLGRTSSKTSSRRARRNAMSTIYSRLPEVPAGSVVAAVFPFTTTSFLEEANSAGPICLDPDGVKNGSSSGPKDFNIAEPNPGVNHTSDKYSIDFMLKPESALRNPDNSIVLYDRGPYTRDEFMRDAVSGEGPLVPGTDICFSMPSSENTLSDEEPKILTTLAEIMHPTPREELELSAAGRLPGATAETKRQNITDDGVELGRGVDIQGQRTYLYQVFVSQRTVVSEAMPKIKFWTAEAIGQIHTKIEDGKVWERSYGEKLATVDDECATMQVEQEDFMKLFTNMDYDEEDWEVDMNTGVAGKEASIAGSVTPLISSPLALNHSVPIEAEDEDGLATDPFAHEYGTSTPDKEMSAATMFSPLKNSKGTVAEQILSSANDKRRIDWLEAKYRFRATICQVLNDMEEELERATYRHYKKSSANPRAEQLHAIRQDFGKRLSSRGFLEALQREQELYEKLAWEILRRDKKLKRDQNRVATLMNVLANKRLW